MKYVLFGAVVLLAACSSWAYDTAHDDIDPDAIVANKEELKSYVDCFLDIKPCHELGTFFKKDFPDTVQTACAKCNPRRKYIVKRFLEGVKERLPESYEVLTKALDPENKLFAALYAVVKDATPN